MDDWERAMRRLVETSRWRSEAIHVCDPIRDEPIRDEAQEAFDVNATVFPQYASDTSSLEEWERGVDALLGEVQASRHRA
jgi:hypothetical protein